MTTEQTQFEDVISRYVDGLMDEGERSAFETRLESDESLRCELALQRELDASLKRSFGRAPSIEAPADTTHLTGGARRWRLWTGLATAALIALAALVGWQAGLLRPATPIEALYANTSPDSIIWRCENDAEFIEHTTTTFGQPLLAAAAPGARVLGWAYIPEPWDASVGLIVAETGEESTADKVLILIEQTPGTVDPSEHGPLNVFQREVGDVTLYEVTRRNAAEVLPLFSVP